MEEAGLFRLGCKVFLEEFLCECLKDRIRKARERPFQAQTEMDGSSDR